MNEKSMTALVSAFARANHSENNDVKIFDDTYAKELLGDDYDIVAKNMSAGIGFFNPTFEGSDDGALRWIVDNYLSPSPLGRGAFSEKALQTAVAFGAKQYLIFAAGYDSFAYRKPSWAHRLSVFEIDHPSTAADKLKRLIDAGIETPADTYHLAFDLTMDDWTASIREHPHFSPDQICFCSLLGITYYLPQEVFRNLLRNIHAFVPEGSSIVFDYPDENSFTQKAGERATKQAQLAAGAKENMVAGDSYAEMEKLLADAGFLIYEHLTPEQITDQYFNKYNEADPKHRMSAFDNVNYCLAVKEPQRKKTRETRFNETRR